MYQVIARKYRPQNFGELIGQEHVKTTIENAINQKRIAHGYIFSGQRGTGKTTVARILARCLNCIEGPTAAPCGVCASCAEIPTGNAMDVIEIDAASNRGINEMRELRENVRFRPARDRYKVFIIDEAHQITNEAFNALLKTLEEPPEWVVFILCTTEVHKIPTTIASRCQQFSFRSVDFAELVNRMRWICEQESIPADDEALAVLAQAGEGSVRDSLSALDQAIACCGGTLTAAQVRTLLGMFSLESLGTVAEALAASDSTAMLGVVQELERNGHNLQHFCRELARYFRNLLVVRIAGQGTRLVAASTREQERLYEVSQKFSEDDLTRYLQLTLDLFKDLQFSLQPRLHLELGLLRLVHAGRLMPIEQAIAAVSQGPGPGSGGSPGSGSGSGGAAGGGQRTSATQPAPRPTARFSIPSSASGSGAAAAEPAAVKPARKPSFSLPPLPDDGPVGSAASSEGAGRAGTKASFSLPALPEDRPARPRPSVSFELPPMADDEPPAGAGRPGGKASFELPPMPLDEPPGSGRAPAGAGRAGAKASFELPPMPDDEPPGSVLAPDERQAAVQPAGHADLQRQLIVALTEAGLAFIADSVAHADIEAKGGELIFTVATRADKMAIESDVPKVAPKVLGRVVKVTAKIGTPVNKAPVDLPPPPKAADEAEVAERALSHPEVKRFTELFPDAHVRQVRNLKN